MKKHAQKKILFCLLLALTLSVLAGCGKKEAGGEKQAVTIIVTHKDGSQNVKEVETACDNLADAMAEADMLDPSLADGTYYTVVDGEEANTDAEEWWCLTIDGEAAVTGFDDTPIKDGQTYEVTFTIGW